MQGLPLAMKEELPELMQADLFAQFLFGENEELAVEARAHQFARPSGPTLASASVLQCHE